MKITVPDLRDGYLEVLECITACGREVSPRGYKTYEIEDATVEIKDPTRLLPVGVGRDPVAAIGAAEAILLCGGLASPSLLTNVSGTFKRFLDGGVLHGAYGQRVRPQMDNVIRRLRDDKDTRQAIVHIWDPLYDSVDTRDMPCTLGFGFRIRDGGLHMSATMRSQDAWLGLCYDAFFFGQLGWTVANVLDLELTRLTLHQYSLHIYDRNMDAIERLHHFDGVGYEEPRGFGWKFTNGGQHWCPLTFESYRKRAERVYNQEPLTAPSATESERWYEQTLAPFDRLTPTANFSS